MFYYIFDNSVDGYQYIVYDPDGNEVIACNDEDEALGYVYMFNKEANS